MKKNAFTLIELLATVLIILLITVLVFSSIINVNDDTRKKACEAKKKLIVSGAKEWGEDHVNDLGTECSYVFVRDLIAGNYVTADAEDKTILKNPVTNGSMNNVKACVTYVYEDNVYKIKAIVVEEIGKELCELNE